jgi:tRNA threonylcarbamoyladenosine dehydratase
MDHQLTEPSRAYTGVSRLYGEPAATQLQLAHVMVVGIGGVGSWAAEALARSGIGRITLVDLDVIAESNINRQIHALQDTLGRNKVDVMQERIAAINPQCAVTVVDDFLTIDNIAAVLEPKPHFVIDAIDSPRVKSYLIDYCVKKKIGLAVAGAAGGRDDPLALQEVDLALTTGDALLANTRSRMRRDFGFTREKGKKFGVRTVCSRQVPLQSLSSEIIPNNGAPLNCAGYGSIVTVTAAMGMALAGIAIKQVLTSIPQ